LGGKPPDRFRRLRGGIGRSTFRADIVDARCVGLNSHQSQSGKSGESQGEFAALAWQVIPLTFLAFRVTASD
jgi:hypothetical protein